MAMLVGAAVVYGVGKMTVNSVQETMNRKNRRSELASLYQIKDAECVLSEAHCLAFSWSAGLPFSKNCLASYQVQIAVSGKFTQWHDVNADHIIVNADRRRVVCVVSGWHVTSSAAADSRSVLLLVPNTTHLFRVRLKRKNTAHGVNAKWRLSFEDENYILKGEWSETLSVRTKLSLSCPTPEVVLSSAHCLMFSWVPLEEVQDGVSYEVEIKENGGYWYVFFLILFIFKYILYLFILYLF
jgi:hypothetical protein